MTPCAILRKNFQKPALSTAIDLTWCRHQQFCTCFRGCYRPARTACAPAAGYEASADEGAAVREVPRQVSPEVARLTVQRGSNLPLDLYLRVKVVLIRRWSVQVEWHIMSLHIMLVVIDRWTHPNSTSRDDHHSQAVQRSVPN